MTKLLKRPILPPSPSVKMTEDVEVDTRQIYLIPTEGPDGMQNTEVGVRVQWVRENIFAVLRVKNFHLILEESFNSGSRNNLTFCVLKYCRRLHLSLKLYLKKTVR